MKVYRVGGCGLHECTVGMFARTNNGIVGMITCANTDNLLLGPELIVDNCIMCIERNSIIRIKERFVDLLIAGDVINKKVVVKVKQNSVVLYHYDIFKRKYIKEEVSKHKLDKSIRSYDLVGRL